MAADSRSAAPVLWPRSDWEWFGSAAHLIVGEDCRFHLATLVGPWMVSTVGEYLPDSAVREVLAESRGITLEGRGDERRSSWARQAGWEDIGHGRKYETMVFRATDERCTADDCDCELPVIREWSELDSDGYNLRGDAQRGHLAMCEKWATKPEGSPPSWENDDA